MREKGFCPLKGVSGCILPQKIFKLEIFGNKISGHRVILSNFVFKFRGSVEPFRDLSQC